MTKAYANFSELLLAVRTIAKTAGAAIMAVYEGDVANWHKADGSPLTEADLAAHQIIVKGLRALTPDLPILSEEDADIDWVVRKAWNQYWLVDPLDGTKEFLKRNGEFTVNIALIDNGVPVLGVVYAPALNRFWWGSSNTGAFTSSGRESERTIHVPLSPAKPLRVVGSRSHSSPEFVAYIEQLGDVVFVATGSSIKLCLIAEGSADLYPRLGPTSEWDTAAAHAIVLAAGGEVVDFAGQALRYNQKDSLLNPHFLVRARQSI